MTLLDQERRGFATNNNLPLQFMREVLKSQGVDPDTYEQVAPAVSVQKILQDTPVETPTETPTPEPAPKPEGEVRAPGDEHDFLTPDGIGGGLVKRGAQFAGGVTKNLIVRTVETLEDLGDWFTSSGIMKYLPGGAMTFADIPTSRRALSHWIDSVLEPAIPAASSPTERVAREIMTVMIPGAVATKLMTGALAGTQAAHVAAMAGGAIADAVFIDPDDPLLIDSIGKLPPDLRDAVEAHREGKLDEADYRRVLASRLTRRFSGVVEGAIIGEAIDGLFHLGRWLRHADEAVKQGVVVPRNAGGVIEDPASGVVMRRTTIGLLDASGKPIPGTELRQVLREHFANAGRNVPDEVLDVSIEKAGEAARVLAQVDAELILKNAGLDPASTVRMTQPIRFLRDAVDDILAPVGLSPEESVRVFDAFVGEIPDGATARTLVDRLKSLTPPIEAPIESLSYLGILAAAIAGGTVALSPGEVEASPAGEISKSIAERFRAIAERGARVGEQLRPPTRALEAEVVRAGRIAFENITNSGDIEEAMRALEPRNVPSAQVVGDVEVDRLTKALGFRKDELLQFTNGRVPLTRTTRAGLVALSQSKTKLRELARRVIAGDEEAKALIVRHFAVHSDLGRATLGLRSELGRALRTLQRDAAGEIQFLQDIENALRSRKLSTGSTVEDLANAILDMSDEQVNEFARKVTDPTWGGALREYWKAAILSSPKTQLANIAGNAFTTFWNIPETFTTGALARFTGGSARETDALDLMYGLLNGLGDALSVGVEAFRRGESVIGGASKFETPHLRQMGAQLLGVDPASTLGRTADFLGEAFRTPFRLLTAADDVFKTLNQRGEFQKLAKQYARETGEPLEQILTHPPAELMQRSMKNAEVLTFTNSLLDPEAGFESLRTIGAAIQSTTIKHPALQFLAPFVRTPTNLATYALERTPVLNFASKRFWQDLRAGGNRGAQAAAKFGTSMLMGLLVGTLAQQGKITGEAPQDPGLRALWFAEHPEFSIRVGDRWVSYDRADPLGLMLATYAAIGQALRHGETFDDAVTGAVVGFADVFANKTYVRGMAEVIDAIRGGRFKEGSLEGATKIGLNVLEGFFPNIVREADRALQPYRADVETLGQYVRARTPGFSTGPLSTLFGLEDLPPMRNFFGEKVVYGYGFDSNVIDPMYRFTSPLNLQKARDDVISKEVQAKHFTFAMHRPVINSVELNPKQYERYLQLIGQTEIRGRVLREEMEAIIKSPTYQAQPVGVQEAWLRSVVMARRAMAKARMLDEYPALITRQIETIQQRFGEPEAR